MSCARGGQGKSWGGIVVQFDKVLESELIEAHANADVHRERPASAAWLIVAAASAWLPIAIAAWLYYASKL